MSKRGGHPYGMIQKSAPDDAADSHQPSQKQLDYTTQMNAWFQESLRNSLNPAIDAITKDENKKLNEVSLRMLREIGHLHHEISVLTHVLMKSMTPDKYQRRLQEVRDELNISVKYKPTLYCSVDEGVTSLADDVGLKRDEDGIVTDNRPSIFTTVIKARPDDDTDKPEPLVTRDIPEPTKETRSWLMKLLNG